MFEDNIPLRDAVSLQFDAWNRQDLIWPHNEMTVIIPLRRYATTGSIGGGSGGKSRLGKTLSLDHVRYMKTLSSNRQGKKLLLMGTCFTMYLVPPAWSRTVSIPQRHAPNGQNTRPCHESRDEELCPPGVRKISQR